MKCNNSYEKQRKKRNKKCLQPERVPGIISVRPDTSDTAMGRTPPGTGDTFIIKRGGRFCNAFPPRIRPAVSVWFPLSEIKNPASAGYTADTRFPPGDNGIRTRDLCVANATLSQLSYVPILVCSGISFLGIREDIPDSEISPDGKVCPLRRKVETTGLEPATPCV